MPPAKTRAVADSALLLAAVIWGVAFLFQKSAMAHVGPFAFIAARGLVAALALAPLAVRERARAGAASPRGFWSISAWGGLAFFVAAALQQIGLETATVTNAGFLTGLYVVLTPFVAWIWFRKTPSAIVWPAAALSAVGIWLLGGGTFGALARGDMLVAASALFWAIHVVISARAAVYDRPIGFTAAQFAVVGVLGAAAAAALETTTLAGLAAAGIDIAYVALLSSALTFTIMTAALRHTPPAEAAVIVSVETLFAAFAAYVFLGERLTAIGWIGAALILAATLLLHLSAVVAALLRRSSGTA
jgi:drug/metabolite transporter (DMT)-like permease